MSLLSSFVKKTARQTGRAVEDVLDEVMRSPRNLRKLLRDVDPTQVWRGPKFLDQPKPIVPPEYAKSVTPEWNDLLDQFENEGDVSACQQAGAKAWTIPITVIIAAGALAADTDLGGTTNPFAAANSAFFTSTGQFPQPFLCYGISGTISATQPAAATEVAAVLDSLYMSMRATTELTRQSLTRDLGLAIVLQGNVAAAAATGAATIDPKPYRSWRQMFNTRQTYTWGARVPRAVTTVGAITYTLLLRGFLMEGGSVGKS